MKLDPELQKAVSESDERTDDGEFEPLPDGFYLAKVEKISLSDRPGPSGYKQWVIVWRIQAPKQWAKRTVWDRRSLSPKAAFKIRELFDALGYEYDSDSDELVGETAVLEIIQREIESGKRKGEIGNDVEQCLDAEANRALVAK